MVGARRKISGSITVSPRHRCVPALGLSCGKLTAANGLLGLTLLLSISRRRFIHRGEALGLPRRQPVEVGNSLVIALLCALPEVKAFPYGDGDKSVYYITGALNIISQGR
jgi:hypothetical protein